MELRKLDIDEHFALALRNWLCEALHAASVDQWDLEVAFDDRDFVERQLVAGQEICPAQREALDTADSLFARQAPRIIAMFGRDHWYERTAEDHYARRFVHAHGGTE